MTQTNNYKVNAVPNKQSGLAVVECVIALPLVLFLILAVGELGNAILKYNTLTQTVRDGARYAAEIAGAGEGVILLTDDKIDDTKNIVVFGNRLTGTPVLPGLTDNDVDVTLTGALSQDIQVSASYDYQPIFFPNIPGVVGSGNAGGTFEMNTTIIMRVL